MSDIRTDSPGANAARLERQRILAVDPKPEPQPHDDCIYILDVQDRVAECVASSGPITDEEVYYECFEIVEDEKNIEPVLSTQRKQRTRRIWVSWMDIPLAISILLVIVCGMASMDLVRSMWGHQGYSPANGWLIETLGGLFK